MFRIGTLLLHQGLIDEAQLHHALTHQAQLKARGRIVPLGQILIDMGAVSEAQIRAALHQQRVLNARAAEAAGRPAAESPRPANRTGAVKGR